MPRILKNTRLFWDKGRNSRNSFKISKQVIPKFPFEENDIISLKTFNYALENVYSKLLSKCEQFCFPDINLVLDGICEHFGTGHIALNERRKIMKIFKRSPLDNQNNISIETIVKVDAILLEM